jgi:hypothetical protein
VLRKAESWELPVELMHDPVTRDFGDDARRSDRERESVALDNTVVWQREIFHRETIDEAVIGGERQGFHRPPHREVSGAKDIERIDFLMASGRDGPGNGRVRGESLVERVPFFGADFLGIVQSRAAEIYRKDDGCRRNWTGQRPSTRLVDASDPRETTGMKGEFESKVWHGRRGFRSC